MYEIGDKVVIGTGEVGTIVEMYNSKINPVLVLIVEVGDRKVKYLASEVTPYQGPINESNPDEITISREDFRKMATDTIVEKDFKDPDLKLMAGMIGIILIGDLEKKLFGKEKND